MEEVLPLFEVPGPGSLTTLFGNQQLMAFAREEVDCLVFLFFSFSSSSPGTHPCEQMGSVGPGFTFFLNTDAHDRSYGQAHNHLVKLGQAVTGVFGALVIFYAFDDDLPFEAEFNWPTVCEVHER